MLFPLTGLERAGHSALVGGVDANGKSIFEGRAATGFTNEEEIQADGVKSVPFLLEDKIKSLGGKFEKADKPWGVSAHFLSLLSPTDSHYLYSLMSPSPVT